MARRINLVNPGMSRDEVKRKAKRACRVLSRIEDLPRYSEVINMNHEQLNLLLQQCPESPYFAKDDFQTSEQQARNLVLAFVERARFGSEGPLREATPSNEESLFSGAREE